MKQCCLFIAYFLPFLNVAAQPIIDKDCIGEFSLSRQCTQILYKYKYSLRIDGGKYELYTKGTTRAKEEMNVDLEKLYTPNTFPKISPFDDIQFRDPDFEGKIEWKNDTLNLLNDYNLIGKLVYYDSLNLKVIEIKGYPDLNDCYFNKVSKHNINASSKWFLISIYDDENGTPTFEFLYRYRINTVEENEELKIVRKQIYK